MGKRTPKRKQKAKPDARPIYAFSENNSGGSWWLDRKHYDALMAAGWYYEPSEYDRKEGHDKKPWLGGDDVPYGWRHNLRVRAATIREAVESWEKATGQDFFAQGCNCCGVPFSMSRVDAPKGEYEYISGSDADISVCRPW